MSKVSISGRRRAIAAAVASLFAPAAAFAGPAMATADGFGANVTGGGGVGDVYHVTTLDPDPTGVIPGSLRYGLYNKNFATWKEGSTSLYGKRTIVFDVGGTIALGSGSLDVKDVSNVTIAGQTAPTPIVITGNTVQITGSRTNNVIFQYVTIRNPSAGEDSLSIKGGGPNANIVADHISTSWGKDEQISVTQGASNVTVQNSFAAEALDSSSHAYGALVRPDSTAKVSYLKNLFANDRSRNPRPGSYDEATLNFDFKNNVIYNYSDRAGYTGGEGHDVVNMNYVGNYIIAGPYTTSAASQIAFTVDNSGDGVNLNAYQSGNLVDANGWGATVPGLKNTTSAGKVTYGKDAVRDGVDKGWGAFVQLTGGTSSYVRAFNQSATPVFNVTSKFEVDATTAYEQVLASGGNFAWARDATDARVVAQIKAGIGDVLNAAPAGELAAINANANAANWVYREANFDTDNDGISNAWELQHGLNPNSTTTKLVYNSVSQKVTTATSGFEGWTGGESNVVSPNGYTWLEVYLAELGLQAAWAGGSGNWGATLAWNGVLPNAQGATARFGASATPAAVNVTGDRHVGQLELNGTGGYTIGGAGAITIDVIQGYGIVRVGSGNHTIGATLNLASNAHFDVAGGAALDVSGALNAAGRVVTKEGGGAVRFNNVRAAALNVTGGSVVFRDNATANAAAGVSAVGSLAIATGASVDLTNNALVVVGAGGSAGTFALTAANGSPAELSVRNMLAGGQLLSSSADAGHRLGYGDNARLGLASVGGLDPGTNSLVIEFVLGGDADLSGTLDSADFQRFLANYADTSGTRVWREGDFTYDGNVTLADFDVMLAGFAAQGGDLPPDVAAFAASLVPEPTSLAALAPLAIALRRRRR